MNDRAAINERLKTPLSKRFRFKDDSQYWKYFYVSITEPTPSLTPEGVRRGISSRREHKDIKASDQLTVNTLMLRRDFSLQDLGCSEHHYNRNPLPKMVGYGLRLISEFHRANFRKSNSPQIYSEGIPIESRDSSIGTAGCFQKISKVDLSRVNPTTPETLRARAFGLSAGEPLELQWDL